MEDSKTKINEELRSQCYLCSLGTSDMEIYVPYGAIEQFVNMCIRSGISVTIIPRRSDLIV